jgi:hypothetical protein
MVGLWVNDETPAPRLSYGAQKLVCEILIDDYTRRGYIDGRALRLPAVLVRPGGPNTAVSGWSSAIIREPLAGRDYVCPVRPDTRLACISSEGRAVFTAPRPPVREDGPRRTMLLNGISASAQEMWTQSGKAAGNVRFSPIRASSRSWTRAQVDVLEEARIGLPREREHQEIVVNTEAASRITVEVDRAPHRAFARPGLTS